MLCKLSENEPVSLLNLDENLPNRPDSGFCDAISHNNDDYLHHVLQKDLDGN